MINVIDASDLANLTTLDHISLPDLMFTDVKVCGQAVFATYGNRWSGDYGGVYVTRRYNTTTKSLQLLHNIQRKPAYSQW